MRDIGRQGDIGAESEAFLLQIGIDSLAFPEEVVSELPVVPSAGWKIPAEVCQRGIPLTLLCDIGKFPSPFFPRDGG